MISLRQSKRYEALLEIQLQWPEEPYYDAAHDTDRQYRKSRTTLVRHSRSLIDFMDEAKAKFSAERMRLRFGPWTHKIKQKYYISALIDAHGHTIDRARYVMMKADEIRTSVIVISLTTEYERWAYKEQFKYLPRRTLCERVKASISEASYRFMKAIRVEGPNTFTSLIMNED